MVRKFKLQDGYAYVTHTYGTSGKVDSIIVTSITEETISLSMKINQSNTSSKTSAFLKSWLVMFLLIQSSQRGL